MTIQVVYNGSLDSVPLHVTSSAPIDNGKDKDVFHESMEQLTEGDCPISETSESNAKASAQQPQDNVVSSQEEARNDGEENDTIENIIESMEASLSSMSMRDSQALEGLEYEEEEEDSSDDDEDELELKKSVSWPKLSVVSETRYRPTTSPEMKKVLHYSGADMLRFRKEYRIEMKAKKLSQKQKKAQVTSPITGLINMVTSYMAMPASTKSFLSSTASTSTTSSSSTSSPQRKKAGSSAAESHTSLLVDTLYLF